MAMESWRMSRGRIAGLVVVGIASRRTCSHRWAPTETRPPRRCSPLGGSYDYAEWDVGQDIFLATFTNGQATNLQAYAGSIGPVGASDIRMAFRH
jgi:hypothetical protein